MNQLQVEFNLDLVCHVWSASTPIYSSSDAPIPTSADNSNNDNATISDATGNSLSDEPMSNPELDPNYELFNGIALQTDDTDSGFDYELFNNNALQTDGTNSNFGFNIDVGSTTPAHSDTNVPQITTAPATLPSGSVPGPAVLALATITAVRRCRQQSFDANDIVEGSRRRKQSKRARGEA